MTAAIRLGARLQAVADRVPVGARLADIGSDHAKLPLWLLAEGRIDFALAGEVRRGPYDKAVAAIAAAGLSADRIAARLANGLAVLEADGGIDTVVIAGLGGLLMRQILADDEAKLSGLATLILQPNNEETVVRRFLADHGFVLADEAIVEDRGKIYELMVARHGVAAATAQEIRFGGRRIWGSPIFQKKWRRRLAEINKILELLPDGEAVEREQLLVERDQIGEVLS